MRRLRLSALASMLLVTASPSLAQVASAQAVAPVADIDSARLAAAEPIGQTIFPDGTYKRILGETMSKLMEGMMGSMMQLPIRDIVKMTGVSSDKVSALDETSIQQIAEIVDPYFRKRMSTMMDTMFSGMGDLMTQFEPRLRTALTKTFARKFDVAELSEIKAFMATPTGSKFAGDYMTMFLEPEIMGEMQSMTPELVKKMPDMLAPAIKAADSLPPPRKFSELSKTEQDKLATLLGVDPADLRKSAARSDKGNKT